MLMAEIRSLQPRPLTCNVSQEAMVMDACSKVLDTLEVESEIASNSLPHVLYRVEIR